MRSMGPSGTGLARFGYWPIHFRPAILHAVEHVLARDAHDLLVPRPLRIDLRDEDRLLIRPRRSQQVAVDVDDATLADVARAALCADAIHRRVVEVILQRPALHQVP